MTEPRKTIGPDVPPPPPRPVEWRLGLSALRELLADPDKTEKAFEVFLRLDGDGEERTFQRFLREPHGARLATERPSLLERLVDREALERLPDGSFGRAYADYLRRAGLDPAGLMKLKCELVERAKVEGVFLPERDPTREWFRDRTILLHDLWHVLTGYGTDEFGEAALLYFTHAQVGGRANAIFIGGIGIRTILAGEIGYLPDLARAWRRGRRAAWLTALPYEDLLELPLEDVRRGAAIEPGEVAHPGGIRRGSYSVKPQALAS